MPDGTAPTQAAARTSMGRIVPAIPHSLMPKPRPRPSQHVVPSEPAVTDAETPSEQQSKLATPASQDNGVNVSEAVVAEPSVRHIEELQQLSAESATTAKPSPASTYRNTVIPEGTASTQASAATHASGPIAALGPSRANVAHLVFGAGPDSTGSSTPPTLGVAEVPNNATASALVLQDMDGRQPYNVLQGPTPHIHDHYSGPPPQTHPPSGMMMPHSREGSFTVPTFVTARPPHHSRRPSFPRAEQIRPSVMHRHSSSFNSARHYDDQSRALHADHTNARSRPFQPHATFAADRTFADPMLGFLNLPEARQTPLASEDADLLARHLRNQFAHREYSDHVVHISHAAYLFPPVAIPCHSIILARSPKLRSLMAMTQSGPSTHPKHLNVIVPDSFINHHIAIVKALMRLYGDSPLDLKLMSALFGPLPAACAEQMQFALAYAAAGHYLELDDVISRGLELASGLLRWDVLGKPLLFALDGGLSPAWNQVDNFTEDRGSSDSAEDIPSRIDSPASAPAYGIYSDRLIAAVMDFVLRSFPSDFHFLASATQLTDLPRLPIVAEPHHSRSNSRLSQIRFGEMTIDDQQTPNPNEHIQISAVLLSLPFALLKHIMEHDTLLQKLGSAAVTAIAQGVVKEREIRRQRAVQQGAWTIGSEERLWHNTRWAERVDFRSTDNGSGIVLVRQHVGVRTPTSSASAKS